MIHSKYTSVTRIGYDYPPSASIKLLRVANDNNITYDAEILVNLL